MVLIKSQPSMQKENEYLKMGRKEKKLWLKKGADSKKVWPWPANWRNPLEDTLAILSEK